jgi:hypothetical protein
MDTNLNFTLPEVNAFSSASICVHPRLKFSGSLLLTFPPDSRPLAVFSSCPFAVTVGFLPDSRNVADKWTFNLEPRRRSREVQALSS